MADDKKLLLKRKYRVRQDIKSTRRVKAGNSGNKSKAEKRGPRVPVSLSLSGTRGWKKEFE